MEAFSLLKYWRGGGVFTRHSPNSTPQPTHSSSSSTTTTTTTTIVTAVSPSSSSSSSSDSDTDGGDDGPFFDLEFTLPQEDHDHDHDHDCVTEDQTKNPAAQNDVEEGDNEVVEEEEDGLEEIKFTLSSSSSADSNDPNAKLSPSDDLFFKGHLVPIDSSSMILSTSESSPKFPPLTSILKSATKFRLKFNKSKSNLSEKTQQKSEPDEKPENQERKQESKFFTVKLKVEEIVPLPSLFTRDNSSKGKNTKSINQNNAAANKNNSNNEAVENTDEKLFSKDVMQKYLKKVKPLYIRVSKKYGDKLRFSGQLNFPKPGADTSPATAEISTGAKAEAVGEVAGGSVNVVGSSSQKQGNLQAGLRVVCKHLGKSRSASAYVVTAPAPAQAPAAAVASKRRDDSLLQQQDGIQSAILHCKRSFNASRDLEATMLSRSVSDPSHENG